jgi:outer membrane protein assembly factor BamA
MNLLLSLFFMLLTGLVTMSDQQHFFCTNVSIITVETGKKVEFKNSTVQQALSMHFEDLTNLGYLNAVADSIVNCSEVDFSSATVYIRQGPRFRVRHIEISSDRQYSYHIYPDVYFTSNHLETLVTSILDSLNQSGFPFANATIEGLFPDSLMAEVSPRIMVDHADQVEIQNVTFTGLQQLTTEYLKQTIRFEPGLLFSPETASKYHQRLISNTFIIDAEQPELTGVGGQWHYLFRIEEVRPGSGDLLLGYNPSGGQASGLVGRGELRLDNLVSIGSRAGFMFEKLPAFETRLLGSYSQFWLGRLPVEFTVSGNLHQRDSTYITRGVGLRSSYYLSDHSWVGWSINSRFTDADERRSDFSITDGRNTMISLDYGVQKTDRRVNPTRGYRYSVTLGSGRRSIKNVQNTSGIPDGRIDFIQINATAKYYLNLVSNQVLVPSISVHYKSMDVFFRDDLEPVGGALSLRGYNEEQFLASQYLWSDVEYRYILDRFSYLFIFGATGRVYYPEITGNFNSDTIHTNVASAGFGISYRVRVGMLRFTYALSNAASVSNGKVHFGISSTF